MGTFGTLLCLWILLFIITDTNFANWTSRVFTEPWPGCPPRYLRKYLGSQDLGARGRLRALQPPWGPCPGHAPGRCRASTRQCRGQHSVLFPLSFLGSIWDVSTALVWVYTGAFIDLEIWTLGLQSSSTLSVSTF